MSRNAPPKKRLLTTKPHSFPFVFAVCLHSIQQTNHIIAKCKWHNISHKKACAANNEGFLRFLAFFQAAHMPPKSGCVRRLWSWWTKKKCEWKPQVQTCASWAHRYVQLIHKRRYTCIFWRCLIVSINQGLKASYRLKTGEKSGIQNSLSTNRAKLLDFLVPLLGKLK